MPILPSFVTFDLETTGIDAGRYEIIEIAAAGVRDGKIVDEFHSLVKPKRKPGPHIERITGIAPSDLNGQPAIADVLPKFLEFVAARPMFAHNAEFDVSFLEAAGARGRLPAVFDTLELARLALPRLTNHKLETLLGAFGFEPEERHRAGADTRVLVDVVHALVDTLAAKPFQRLEQIAALAEGARSPAPPRASVAELVREVIERAAKRGVGGPGAPNVKGERLVWLPNLLGDFGEARLEPEEAVQTVETEVVRSLLSADGPLAPEIEDFRERPSQVEMAEAVTGALNDSEILVCEAGTGTGKSVAYLVPAILWAIRNGRRIVVSTNTKNLQEQLFYKDLPLLARALEVDLRAVLLKGRSNYLCLNRWRSGSAPGMTVATEREREYALPIATWLEETQSGDISENVAFQPIGQARGLWTKLSAEGQPCTPNACPCYNECYVTRVRRAAQQAHVVVVNHSLLFSDLLAENAILGEYSDLIIDEAHNLERVASDYLGLELSWWAIRDTMHRIYAKETDESGLVARIKAALGKSAIGADDVKAYQMQASASGDAVQAAVKAGQALFEKLGSSLQGAETPSRFSHKARYTSEDDVFASARDEIAALDNALKALDEAMRKLVDWLRELQTGKLPQRDEFVADLENRVADVGELVERLHSLTAADDDKLVYWYEIPSERASTDVRLYAAPLHVGADLDERFYPRFRSVVMTSATLAVAGKFTYFLDRVGLNGKASERTRTVAVGSPFDYEKQALVAVPKWFPSPKSPAFQEAVTELVRDAILHVRRGTLVLFTSYRMLNDTHRAVRDDLHGAGIVLLGQGIDGSRTTISEAFRAEPGSVLFGTESFWQGVDMPGEALELLIIVKLPFSVPTEPLVIAQGEELKKAGKDPFLYMTVPEAAIRFRQGFGRLIRTEQDRGAVLILDTRVVTERFGRAFTGSLPTPHRTFGSSRELLAALDKWFASQ